ncbi:MAG: heparinase II/III-family protein [Phycisphaerales bacterium]|nr:heparinase II/III-family protein [Phycisphaerales bacterium]
MRQHDVLEQLQQRAQRYAGRRRLVVDYYRIRRRVAYPWPLTELPLVQFKASGLESYPWHTWFAWSVEERINALGWAAELGGDQALRQRCREEIASIARWPTHISGAPLDLCFGHLMRMLVMARRNWSWLGASVQAEIFAACRRAVEQKRVWMAENLPKFQTAEAILAADNPDYLTRNIPLIGAIALTMAAYEIQDPSAEAMRNHVLAFLRARLDLLGRGSSEDVAYDGYVLDFFADLVPLLPVQEREAILEHPGIRETLAMSWQLAAPGEVLNVANLGDTEPQEMPFHASAHAKFAAMLKLAESSWYLSRVRLDWLRSEALGYLYHLPGTPAQEPAEKVATGPYGITLRTGWSADDTAVAIGAPRGGMGHLHCDGGSILIGRGGTWLIADPGYQQYLPTREREFTLGPSAHNAPVINGHSQDRRNTKILSADTSPTHIRHVLLDLTNSYPAAANITAVRRHVWLLPDGTVVLCDDIAAADLQKIAYTFHGIPGASWWAQDQKAVIYYQGAELWIASPTAPLPITQQNITRLRGSRGHESLVTELTPSPASPTLPTTCWWLFNIGPAPIVYTATADSLSVGSVTLTTPSRT